MDDAANSKATETEKEKLARSLRAAINERAERLSFLELLMRQQARGVSNAGKLRRIEAADALKRQIRDLEFQLSAL